MAARQQNLTPLILDVLLAPSEKQVEKIPHRSAYINKSFVPLVNRGLLIIKDELLIIVHIPGTLREKAFSMLKYLGIIADCGGV